MSRSYTPGLKILSRTKISKHRQLPMKGSVHLKIGDIVKVGDLEQILWPNHCVQKTTGSEFTDSLNSKILLFKPTQVPQCVHKPLSITSVFSLLKISLI